MLHDGDATSPTPFRREPPCHSNRTGSSAPPKKRAAAPLWPQPSGEDPENFISKKTHECPSSLQTQAGSRNGPHLRRVIAGLDHSPANGARQLRPHADQAGEPRQARPLAPPGSRRRCLRPVQVPRRPPEALGLYRCARGIARSHERRANRQRLARPSAARFVAASKVPPFVGSTAPSSSVTTEGRAGPMNFSAQPSMSLPRRPCDASPGASVPPPQSASRVVSSAPLHIPAG